MLRLALFAVLLSGAVASCGIKGPLSALGQGDAQVQA